MTSEFQIEAWRNKVASGEPAKEDPQFKLDDRVRLKRTMNEDVLHGTVIPKGKVGVVVDVWESPRDGSIGYLVEFPKLGESVTVNRFDIKLHPPGTRDLPKKPPKIPSDVKG